MGISRFAAIGCIMASVVGVPLAAARAQGPVISSLSRNGELVATNLPPGSGADVEWAPTVNGPWTNSWNSLRNLLPDSNSSIRVSVPMVYRVRSVPTGLPLPSDLVLIPAGTFAMGDSLDGLAPAVPVHYVQVGDYWISRHEVTKALWDEVYNWAIQNGYSFQYGGQGKAANHPVHSVTWYDAVKWCNARSEKEGLLPAYYTDPTLGLAAVYRTGFADVQNDWVRWTGGYRLPTEAEWEKAARGGVAGQRFWFGDTITHLQANYYSDPSYAYDVSSTRGYHPSYRANPFPFSSPVGSFAANGYGLYDMAGNMWEWCWDWYGSGYYSSSPAADPRGPASGSYRIQRGGSWSDFANFCRSAYRKNTYTPDSRDYNLGFRAVLPPSQP